MQKEYVKQEGKKKPYELSDLQEKILIAICCQKAADYNVIVEKTNRRRTTIFQSLQPLLKHHFVVVKKIYPEQKNSKLVFKTTHKGYFYCIAFLGFDYEKVLKTYLDRESIPIHDHEFIFASRKGFIEQFAIVLMKYDPFDKKGMLRAPDSDDYISLAFRIAFLESVKNKNFNLKEIFKVENIEGFSRLFTPHEKRELINFLGNMNKNMNTVLASLSRQD